MCACMCVCVCVCMQLGSLVRDGPSAPDGTANSWPRSPSPSHPHTLTPLLSPPADTNWVVSIFEDNLGSKYFEDS